MNIYTESKVFIVGVHAGQTHYDTYLRNQALEIDSLVQIDIEPAKGSQIHPINAERVADGRGFRFLDDNVTMYLQPLAHDMYTLCSPKSPII